MDGEKPHCCAELSRPRVVKTARSFVLHGITVVIIDLWAGLAIPARRLVPPRPRPSAGRLAHLTIYVIDVAEGEKIPGKGVAGYQGWFAVGR